MVRKKRQEVHQNRKEKESIELLILKKMALWSLFIKYTGVTIEGNTETKKKLGNKSYRNYFQDHHSYPKKFLHSNQAKLPKYS